MSSTPILSIATHESALDDGVAAERVRDARRSASPETPPYSPITPVMSSASLPEYTHAKDAPPLHRSPPKPEPRQQEFHRPHQQHRHHHQKQQDQQQKPQPHQQQNPPQPRPLLPFSESDNPDAIALRSALSILQIQRQQALHDLKTLERQKHIAAADPEAFAAALMAGRVKTARKGGDGFGISPRPDLFTTLADEAAADENQTEDADETERPASSPPGSKFEDMPGPQDVIRAPPINWAKYHIIGEPLDRLHEEQKARPTPGQPRRGGGEIQSAPKHVIAAPYSPWTDKLPPGNQIRTRGVSRKDQ